MRFSSDHHHRMHFSWSSRTPVKFMRWA